MEILHVRYGFGNRSTLGRLLIDGEFQGFVLEDVRRKVKVYGETCIPAGRYRVTLRTEGDKHDKYLKRFPGVHIGMLWIRDVPDFTYVYYHPGNTPIDTKGCPLPGTVPIISSDGEFTVGSSTAAYLPFYQKVIAAILGGEEVWTLIAEAEAL